MYKTKNREQYTFTQTEKQHKMSHPKTHAHIILTKLNIEDRIKAFGAIGYEAIQKDLKPLHVQEASNQGINTIKHMKKIIAL